MTRDEIRHKWMCELRDATERIAGGDPLYEDFVQGALEALFLMAAGLCAQQRGFERSPTLYAHLAGAAHRAMESCADDWNERN